jgi:hypothetical protein
MDVETRSLVRRRISDERRRRAGAELDEKGLTAMHASPKNNSLPLAAWEACDGDPLLAIVYALDILEAKQEAHPEAA